MAASRNKFSIRVERDRSTDEWIVTEYHRAGWSVRFRSEHQADAQAYAQRMVEDHRHPNY